MRSFVGSSIIAALPIYYPKVKGRLMFPKKSMSFNIAEYLENETARTQFMAEAIKTGDGKHIERCIQIVEQSRKLIRDEVTSLQTVSRKARSSS